MKLWKRRKTEPHLELSPSHVLYKTQFINQVYLSPFEDVRLNHEAR